MQRWQWLLATLAALRAAVEAAPSSTAALKRAITDTNLTPTLIKMDGYALFRTAARLCTHTLLEWLVDTYKYTRKDHWRDGGATVAAAVASDVDALTKARFLFVRLELRERDALAVLPLCPTAALAKFLADRLGAQRRDVGMADTLFEMVVAPRGRPKGRVSAEGPDRRDVLDALALPLHALHHTTVSAAIRALAAAGDYAMLQYLEVRGLVVRATVQADGCAAYLDALAAGHLAVAEWLAKFMTRTPNPALTFLASCRAATSGVMREGVRRASITLVDIAAVKWEAAQLLIARDVVKPLSWMAATVFDEDDTPRLHQLVLQGAAVAGAHACLEWLMGKPTVWAAGAFGLDFADAAAAALGAGQRDMATRLRAVVSDAEFASAAAQRDVLAVAASLEVLGYLDAAGAPVVVSGAALEAAAARGDVALSSKLMERWAGVLAEGVQARVWAAACRSGSADMVRALAPWAPFDNTHLLCTGNLALILELRDIYGVLVGVGGGGVEDLCRAGHLDALVGLVEDGALALPGDVSGCVLAAAGAGHVHTLEWLCERAPGTVLPWLPDCPAAALDVLHQHGMLAAHLLSGRYLAAALSRNDTGVARWVQAHVPPAPRAFLTGTLVHVTHPTAALQWMVDALDACPPSADTLRQCQPGVREWATRHFWALPVPKI